MAKQITKEIIIALLVILASILILGVVLYDFMPNNKVMPEELIYTTSQEVRTQLKAVEGFSAEEVLMTYSLDQTDLDNYQITNDYRPGKTNPFSTYVSTNGGNGSDTSDGTSSGNGSSGGTSGGSSTVKPIDRTIPVKPGEVNPGNYTNDKGLK